MTKVRNYTDKQLLDRVKTLEDFSKYPEGYFMIFVRSNEDQPDHFDDKVYLFYNTGNSIQFKAVTSCTTNPGTYGLLNFKKWNRHGTAVLAFDKIYYQGWKSGLHRKKIKAWVQNKKVTVFRDNNRNNKSEELGIVQSGYFGINIHTVTYKWYNNIVKKLIGRWSAGCMVLNNTTVYRNWFNMINKEQKTLSVILLNEF